jgi:hypothetical protein
MEFVTVDAIAILKEHVLFIINDSAFQAAQMANTVTAEAVCAIIRSRAVLRILTGKGEMY